MLTFTNEKMPNSRPFRKNSLHNCNPLGTLLQTSFNPFEKLPHQSIRPLKKIHPPCKNHSPRSNQRWGKVSHQNSNLPEPRPHRSGPRCEQRRQSSCPLKKRPLLKSFPPKNLRKIHQVKKLPHPDCSPLKKIPWPSYSPLKKVHRLSFFHCKKLSYRSSSPRKKVHPLSYYCQCKRLPRQKEDPFKKRRHQSSSPWRRFSPQRKLR